jgi:hypothetical protein
MPSIAEKFRKKMLVPAFFSPKKVACFPVPAGYHHTVLLHPSTFRSQRFGVFQAAKEMAFLVSIGLEWRSPWEVGGAKVSKFV